MVIGNTKYMIGRCKPNMKKLNQKKKKKLNQLQFCKLIIRQSTNTNRTCPKK